MEVLVDYNGKMRFKTQCANHQLIIDLPQSDGGETPSHMFRSSLASCVGTYISE